MARLPQVGGDDGSWGIILNDFLAQAHTNDGALKANSVGAAQLKAGSVDDSKLSPDLLAAVQAAGPGMDNSDDLDEGANHLFLRASERTQLAGLDAALEAKANVADLNNRVPLTRTVNGKDLSGDVTLSAHDVGARAETWNPAWSDVANRPEFGTAAAANASDFATAAQGTKADAAVPVAQVAVAHGVASLDGDAHLPESQLPTRLSATTLEEQAREWIALGSLMRPLSGIHPQATITHTADGSGTFPDAEGVLWSDARIQYLAGTPIEAGPAYGCAVRTTGANNSQSNYFGFHFSGTEFALQLTVWATTDVTIYIDGLAVTVDPYLVTGVGYQFVIISGLSSGAHEVQCVVGWSANFLQLVFHANARLAAAALPSFRFGLVGDSYTDSGIAPHYGGLARELHRLTGWAPAQLGQGSTGYTNNAASEGPGTGKSIYGSTSRINALNALDPDIVIVVGSVNDGGASPVAVQQAAADYYAALAPRQIIVLGVEPLHDPNNPALSAWNSINEAVLTAARDAENVVGIIDWRGEDWLTGTGSVSNPAGDGNQDLFIGDEAGTDTIHANYWGQRYLAERIVRVVATMRIRY